MPIGRFSRGLPLFLAEQIHIKDLSTASATTVVPLVEARGLHPGRRTMDSRRARDDRTAARLRGVSACHRHNREPWRAKFTIVRLKRSKSRRRLGADGRSKERSGRRQRHCQTHTQRVAGCRPSIHSAGFRFALSADHRHAAPLRGRPRTVPRCFLRGARAGYASISLRGTQHHRWLARPLPARNRQRHHAPAAPEHRRAGSAGASRRMRRSIASASNASSANIPCAGRRKPSPTPRSPASTRSSGPTRPRPLRAPGSRSG